MIGCNTHLLKHMKQAILVWSFRQNIFPGCYPEKTSKIGRAVDIVNVHVQGKTLYQEMSAKSMQASEHGDDKSTRIENDINTRPGL